MPMERHLGLNVIFMQSKAFEHTYGITEKTRTVLKSKFGVVIIHRFKAQLLLMQQELQLKFQLHVHICISPLIVASSHLHQTDS